MKLFAIAFYAIFLMHSSSAMAEYRVYQYYVKSKIENVNSPKAEIVTSTLNPQAYIAYNGGTLSVEISLLRTWLCMGNTSKQELCTFPESTIMADRN